MKVLKIQIAVWNLGMQVPGASSGIVFRTIQAEPAGANDLGEALFIGTGEGLAELAHALGAMNEVGLEGGSFYDRYGVAFATLYGGAGDEFKLALHQLPQDVEYDR